MATWPFHRRNSQTTDSSIPPEVQEYYKAEHRERMWLAWLVAFLTLIVTIAVVLGLFFGGRWVYRKTTHQNNKHTTSKKAGTSKQPSSQSKEGAKPNQSTPSKTNTPSQTPGTNITPPTSTPNSASQSATGTTGPLTNTGPGDTVAIFIAVTLSATVGHYLVTRRTMSSSK